jgi:hypothetical protein
MSAIFEATCTNSSFLPLLYQKGGVWTRRLFLVGAERGFLELEIVMIRLGSQVGLRCLCESMRKFQGHGPYTLTFCFMGTGAAGRKIAKYHFCFEVGHVPT